MRGVLVIAGVDIAGGIFKGIARFKHGNDLVNRLIKAARCRDLTQSAGNNRFNILFNGGAGDRIQGAFVILQG